MKCQDKHNCGMDIPKDREPQHTPTPCYIRVSGRTLMNGSSTKFWKISDANGEHIANVFSENDCNSLVRAVNWHEPLLEIAEAYLKLLKRDFPSSTQIPMIIEVIKRAEGL